MDFLKDVPPEVRQMIYVSYLQDATIVWHMPACACLQRWQYCRGNIDAFKLLLLCRRIKDEAEPLAYQHALSVRASCIWKDLGPQLNHAWLQIHRLLVRNEIMGTHYAGEGEVPFFPLEEPLRRATTFGSLRTLEFERAFNTNTNFEMLALRSVINVCKAKDVTSKFKVFTTYQNDAGQFCRLKVSVTIANIHNVSIILEDGIPQATVSIEQIFRYCYGDDDWHETDFRIKTDYDENADQKKSSMPTSEITIAYTQNTYKWLKPESKKNGYTTRWSNESKPVTVRPENRVGGLHWIVHVPVL